MQKRELITEKVKESRNKNKNKNIKNTDQCGLNGNKIE